MKILRYLVMTLLCAASGLYAECMNNDGCTNRFITCSKTSQSALYGWKNGQYTGLAKLRQKKDSKGNVTSIVCDQCGDPVQMHAVDDQGFPLPIDGITASGVKSPC